MDISSISSTPNPGLVSYNSQNTQSAPSTNSSDSAANDNKKTDTSASVVQAIEDAASGNNSLAMIDALKMIGGSGSANIAALVNVAKSAISDNIDAGIVGSIGKSGSNDDIYGVIQNQYAASGNLELYQRIQTLQSDKTSAPAQSDILDTLIHPTTQQSESTSDQPDILDTLIDPSAQQNTTTSDQVSSSQ